MDRAWQAKSLELLKDLIREAKLAEDEAWSHAAELRRAGAPPSELLHALHVIERTTQARVKLEQKLDPSAPGTGSR